MRDRHACVANAQLTPAPLPQRLKAVRVHIAETQAARALVMCRTRESRARATAAPRAGAFSASRAFSSLASPNAAASGAASQDNAGAFSSLGSPYAAASGAAAQDNAAPAPGPPDAGMAAAASVLLGGGLSGAAAASVAAMVDTLLGARHARAPAELARSRLVQLRRWIGIWAYVIDGRRLQVGRGCLDIAQCGPVWL